MLHGDCRPPYIAAMLATPSARRHAVATSRAAFSLPLRIPFGCSHRFVAPHHIPATVSQSPRHSMKLRRHSSATTVIARLIASPAVRRSPPSSFSESHWSSLSGNNCHPHISLPILTLFTVLTRRISARGLCVFNPFWLRLCRVGTSSAIPL